MVSEQGDFFSREIFVAMLSALGSSRDTRTGAHAAFSPQAREVLGILQSDSPLSTKELKRASGLQGKLHERALDEALDRGIRRAGRWCVSAAAGRSESASFRGSLGGVDHGCAEGRARPGRSPSPECFSLPQAVLQADFRSLKSRSWPAKKRTLRSAGHPRQSPLNWMDEKPSLGADAPGADPDPDARI